MRVPFVVGIASLLYLTDAIALNNVEMSDDLYFAEGDAATPVPTDGAGAAAGAAAGAGAGAGAAAGAAAGSTPAKPADPTAAKPDAKD